MSAYATVLVGTDGAESSFRAVDRAATVATGADATGAGRAEEVSPAGLGEGAGG